MSKHLVVCCDGTWGGLPEGKLSNVQRIAQILGGMWQAPGGVREGVLTDDPEKEPQLVLYLPGVGSGYFTDRLLGGALGKGLFQDVLTGYRFLASNYEPGDKIYLFGFSRGAF